MTSRKHEPTNRAYMRADALAGMVNKDLTATAEIEFEDRGKVFSRFLSSLMENVFGIVPQVKTLDRTARLPELSLQEQDCPHCKNTLKVVTNRVDWGAMFLQQNPAPEDVSYDKYELLCHHCGLPFDILCTPAQAEPKTVW